MANSMDGSVCLNHPDQPATCRCDVCRKPICDQCKMERNGMVFCSAECMASAERTGLKVEAVQAGTAREKKRRLRRRLLWLIIIAAAAAGIYVAYAKHGGKMERQVEKLKSYLP